MSRIGKLPVKIPSGVTVTVSDHTVVVTSGKSELSRDLNREMRVFIKDGAVLVERPSESKLHRSLHGLTRTLVWNMIEGVSKGYEKQLELVGVGYRASRQGEALEEQERTGQRRWEVELHRLEGIALFGLNRLEEGQPPSKRRCASRDGSKQRPMSCAPRRALPGCGVNRAGGSQRASSSHRFTAGSPRASTPPI